MPEELLGFTDHFNALNEQEEHTSKTQTVPSVEDLSKLGQRELMQAFEDQWVSGKRIPLKTLTQLPAELRKAGIENYFNQDATFHPDMARQCVDQLERLDLTPSEKQSLLKGAATASWQNQGDYQTALGWAARIPDAKGREEFKKKLLAELARQDPHAALEYIADLPAGELREEIGHIVVFALFLAGTLVFRKSGMPQTSAQTESSTTNSPALRTKAARSESTFAAVRALLRDGKIDAARFLLSQLGAQDPVAFFKLLGKLPGLPGMEDLIRETASRLPWNQKSTTEMLNNIGTNDWKVLA